MAARTGFSSLPATASISARAARSRARDGGPTKADLYARAKRRNIPNRSKMSKKQLENALA